MTNQRTLVNIENNNNLSGKYPLFLGDALGFADTVNVTYPKLSEWYEEQMGQFWRETEFSLEQDKIDIKEADPKERDVMIHNLVSQWLLDSVASRSILETIAPFTTNSEMLSCLTAWTMFEEIHARAYSFIARQCFEDPNVVIQEAKKNINVAYRSAIIGTVFNQTNQMAAKYTQGLDVSPADLRRQLVKTFAALYSLEAVSFMASFACTFALVETGRYQGIGNEITSIQRDEVLHAKLDRIVLDIMLNQEGYAREFNEVKDEVRYIFDEVIRQEFSWAEYIFSEGRRAVGLTTDLLKDYVRYLGKPMYDRLGIYWDEQEFGVPPKTNPLPYMDKYLSPDQIQAAAQEIEITNYRVGSLSNDIGEEDFDF